jgi:hypothetical protein
MLMFIDFQKSFAIESIAILFSTSIKSNKWQMQDRYIYIYIYVYIYIYRIYIYKCHDKYGNPSNKYIGMNMIYICVDL